MGKEYISIPISQVREVRPDEASCVACPFLHNYSVKKQTLHWSGFCAYKSKQRRSLSNLLSHGGEQTRKVEFT